MVKTIPYVVKGANNMKTKEELNALKEEVETVSKKLHELTEEELAQVTGGLVPVFIIGHVRETPVVGPTVSSEMIAT